MTIERLDAGQARAALPDLEALLRDAVEGGASVGFLLPLAAGEVRAYWETILAELDPSQRLLLVARQGGAVVGTVQLALAQKANSAHRAEVQKLLVQRGARGQGIGRRAVEWLTEYLFETWPILDRIEATTRQDNLAMRKALIRNHYAKEGHYRKAWDGHDTIQYAILREDWQSGTVSPVNWDDEPTLSSPA